MKNNAVYIIVLKETGQPAVIVKIGWAISPIQLIVSYREQEEVGRSD